MVIITIITKPIIKVMVIIVAVRKFKSKFEIMLTMIPITIVMMVMIVMILITSITKFAKKYKKNKIEIRKMK